MMLSVLTLNPTRKILAEQCGSGLFVYLRHPILVLSDVGGNRPSLEVFIEKS